MTEEIRLSLVELRRFTVNLLVNNQFSSEQAAAIAAVVYAAQRDECHSHGLYRLFGYVQSVAMGCANPVADPRAIDHAAGIVRVDASFGFSVARGMPLLTEKARTAGLAALMINNCFNLSALWTEVEALSETGLAGISMTVSQSAVAPAGGNKPLFGTNPIAFAWPRPDGPPYVFDFATSVAARGEIELHQRGDKPIPAEWAVDSQGNPTTNAAAALAGAMLTFGGYKGSACRQWSS
ncbi:Ldh family oxidoreductase [Bosea sp. AK1]|uniref:Ldh family oxidoreductase n=1 Tax=Bosea sp. AK1 TaxID=2587160 RepID=UPI0020BE8D5C|nr:Ldh family oxidoreductase [Bosea sp. AK1]